MTSSSASCGPGRQGSDRLLDRPDQIRVVRQLDRVDPLTGPEHGAVNDDLPDSSVPFSLGRPVDGPSGHHVLEPDGRVADDRAQTGPIASPARMASLKIPTSVPTAWKPSIAACMPSAH